MILEFLEMAHCELFGEKFCEDNLSDCPSDVCVCDLEFEIFSEHSSDLDQTNIETRKRRKTAFIDNVSENEGKGYDAGENSSFYSEEWKQHFTKFRKLSKCGWCNCGM